jgi:hypothetical protein
LLKWQGIDGTGPTPTPSASGRATMPLSDLDRAQQRRPALRRSPRVRKLSRKQPEYQTMSRRFQVRDGIFEQSCRRPLQAACCPTGGICNQGLRHDRKSGLEPEKETAGTRFVQPSGRHSSLGWFCAWVTSPHRCVGRSSANKSWSRRALHQGQHWIGFLGGTFTTTAARSQAGRCTG